MPLKVELVTPGPDFSISATGDMPDVQVKVSGPELPAAASTTGAGGAAGTTTQFDWTAKLVFDCSEAPHGPARTVSHPEITGQTSAPQWKIPFTKIRGGKLSIAVTAKVGTQTLTAQLSDVAGKPIRVLGTNPSRLQLHQAISSKALRLIVQHESGCRQFKDGLPLFSQDNLGGVGLLQITSPPPTDDEVWDWQANVRAAIALFSVKLATARGFAGQVRRSAKYVSLVTAYNAARQAAGKAPIEIRLPELTADQVELDAIRGFNGYGGTDFFLGAKHLHEFRVPVKDATGTTPSLVVTEDPGQTFGTIAWERVPRGVRPSAFESYVDNVVSKGDF